MAPNKESNSLQQVQQTRLQQRLNPMNVALGRMLEMSVPEFEDAVRRELDENPALEVRESADTSANSDGDGGDFKESAEELQLADYAGDDDIPSGIRRENRRSGSFDPVSIAPDEGDSQIEALMRRLASESHLSPRSMRVAEQIVGNLDSNGYLTRPLHAIAADIAFAEGFEPSEQELREAFDAVRSLDPAGIGAVDLRDCLMLQLDRLEPTVRSRTAREIVAHYFDLFSKMHYDRLQQALEISRDDLADAVDLIRSLNPKPASALDLARPSDNARHISPDIAVDYDSGSDTFTVSLLGDIPELGIEASFAADEEPAEAEGGSAESRRRQRQAFAFIRRKRDDATAFIHLVEMRARTLLAIAKAIVQLQRPFFISGDSADIRPMVLRDVAAVTGLDLSVISRATAGKYIISSHGVYPVKMFFNERPDADADVSSHEILNAISALTAAEDKRSPLSDRELCDALKAKGYDIARRTVAKYRERLGLPVARLRKQL